MKQTADVRRALILSGGGGRGAYHCGVYEYLEAIGWKPDILVGTSIGAINAAAIASGRTAQELQNLWLRLDSDRVQRLRTDILDFERWTYLLDNSPWRRSLSEDNWFDFAHINSDEAPTLAVATTSVETGDLVIFCNRPLEESLSGLPRSKQVRVVNFSLEHIMASCSIPIVYPWTRVGEGETDFWDGAVVSNTPLGTALRAGATEAVVVLLSPWEQAADEASVARADAEWRLWNLPGVALDWSLLASFRADLKLLEALNMFVAAYDLLTEAQRREMARSLHPGASADEMSLLLRRLGRYRRVTPPRIVAPRELMPIEWIVTYQPDIHRELFKQGYSDAVREMHDLAR